MDTDQKQIGLRKSQSGLTSAATRAIIPEAVAGGCEYLVNNAPCNEGAVMTRRTHSGHVFRLCGEHAGRVEQELKRQGKPVTLSRIVT